MLTKGDDFPIHQTPEPIAYSGTDRNFYDRYFFNGYAPHGSGDQDLFFSVAFGVYPHLNIADAAFCIIHDGVQTSMHASRWLGMERMDLNVGPISIEVMEPLQKLKVTLDAPEHGLKAEVVFTGRAFPIEEPRFIRRNGPRTFMDYTRLTQNGSYTGWVERDGQRWSVDGFVGTRDRSWGIRGVGDRDTQAVVPPVAPQFFWLWGPTNFDAGSFFFHTNDEASGEPWNRRAVWCANGSNTNQFAEYKEPSFEIDWKSGTRHAANAVVRLADKGGEHVLTYKPSYNFYMQGLGYGHPKWSHGKQIAELAVEREDYKLADVNVTQPGFLHIQALCEVEYQSPRRTVIGRGVLEQLVMGPHEPSGFKAMLDMAP
jgi:hypothetical protein